MKVYKFVLILWLAAANAQQSCNVCGEWTYVKNQKQPLTLWDSMTVDISASTEPVTTTVLWKQCYTYNQTIVVPRDGSPTSVNLSFTAYPTNMFLGVERDISDLATQQLIKLDSTGSVLVVQEAYNLRSAQHILPVTVLHTWQSQSGDSLSYSVNITEKGGKLLSTDTYLFSHSTSNQVEILHDPEAELERLHQDRPEVPTTQGVVGSAAAEQTSYVMYLKANWTLSTVTDNALLIGLQGLVNRNGTNLYFVYPTTWAFTYSPEVRNYYATKRGYSFRNLTTVTDAVKTFRRYVKGYVLWDTTVRSSLVVAYTVCGLQDAIPVTAELEPLMQSMGIPKIADFSSRFRNQTDLQIFTWAKQQYWESCNRSSIVWMGGSCHTQIRPGIADWGVMTRSFFVDLSTVPSDPEYQLAADLLSDMTPTKFISFGWHSYCKDQEHTYVTLLSKHGGRAHGLNTLPNLSFINKVPMTKGFKFRNHHNRTPPPTTPPSKVLVGLVQTDGLGLGAWTRPGRGKLPYSWEAGPDDYTLQSSLMEWFYTQATPNDYFVGALSGPGYLYPKAQPETDLVSLLKLANEGFGILDLDIMTIFDASAVPPQCGTSAVYKVDTTLNERAVSTYFNTMSQLEGFLNGYGPSYTFVYNETTHKSLLSFDYYLDPGRSVQDAADDIKLLAVLNPRRPYYLVIHVREFSTIDRVEQIIDLLPKEEFDIVHVDYLLRVANKYPTWQNHYN